MYPIVPDVAAGDRPPCLCDLRKYPRIATSKGGLFGLSVYDRLVPTNAHVVGR